jgi:protein-S-isoprenylcysteine O-methyltransferase Ste14
MTFQFKLVVFLLASLGIIWVSHKPLRDFRSHGFYRFFAWEAILALVLLNLDVWFFQPFQWYQLISWIFLIVSIFMVVQGMLLLRKIGKPDQNREEPSLLGLEKTTALVTIGVYKYIRHPLYSSLFFLAWGAFFKQLSWLGLILGLIATVFLTLTARIEEAENIKFFGETYKAYMQKTRMFVPLVF